MISQTGGGCRATNYIGFLRKALKDAGFEQVPVISLNEVMEEIREKTQCIDSINLLEVDTINEPIPFIVELFQYFKDNSKFMKAILGPKGDPLFHHKVKEFIENNLFEKAPIKTQNKQNILVPETYFISYVLSAHLGVVQHWLESGMDKSPKEMALILSRMFLLGPYKVITSKNTST